MNDGSDIWLFRLFPSCLVGPQVQAMREGLNEEWVGFQQVLIDSDVLLQQHKEKFKNNLVLSYEDFKKKIEATVEDFSAKGGAHYNHHVWMCLCSSFFNRFVHKFVCPGPFQSALCTDSALNQIAEHRAQLETLKDEQNAIFDGLAFYMIKQPPSKKIQMLEKVLSSSRLSVLVCCFCLSCSESKAI